MLTPERKYCFHKASRKFDHKVSVKLKNFSDSVITDDVIETLGHRPTQLNRRPIGRAMS